MPPAHVVAGEARPIGFGEAWLRRSALDLFREDIARFRVILTNEPEEDSLEVPARGGAPRLKAFRLHNGLGARFRWVGGESRTASSLILEHLLPLAREGLRARRIDSSDVDLYLVAVMDWRHARHVPVEDVRGRLVGIVAAEDFLDASARLFAERLAPRVAT